LTLLLHVAHPSNPAIRCPAGNDLGSAQQEKGKKSFPAHAEALEDELSSNPRVSKDNP
jgi:hypothetical protein